MRKLLDEFLPGGQRYKMVSNLPYYITTPILFHFWESGIYFERTVVMVQEEVAHRMVAPVGASDYGILSLAARYYAKVDIVHKAPASCFKPKPKVDSAIVRFRNRAEPLYPDIDRKFLLSVIRAAFSKRRKTLRNSLTQSGSLGAPKEAILEALEAAGIDPNSRPQELDLDAFAQLAKEMAKRV